MANELEDIFKEHLGDETTDLDKILSEHLPDSAILSNEQPQAGEVKVEDVANTEEAKSSPEPSSGYTQPYSGQDMIDRNMWSGLAHPPTPPGPKTVTALQWQRLRKNQQEGEPIDMKQYTIRGAKKDWSDAELQDYADAQSENENKKIDLGHKYYNARRKSINTDYWKAYTPAVFVKEELDNKLEEPSFLGKFAGVSQNVMDPVMPLAKGVGMLQHGGERVLEAEESMRNEYNLKHAEDKAGGRNMDEFMQQQRLAAHEQAQFKDDFEAGLVNFWNEPILSEDEYKAQGYPQTLGPYDEYRKRQYIDSDGKTYDQYESIIKSDEKFTEAFMKQVNDSEDLETGKTKIFNAFDEKNIEALTEEEATAVLSDTGFMEELKMMGEMLVNEPDETLRQMGLYMLQDAPMFFLGSKGLGVIGKLASKMGGLAKAGKLKFMARYGDPKFVKRLEQLKKYQQDVSRTKKILERPTFLKLLGEETARDMALSTAVGYGHEEAIGSDYGGKELVRDMIAGAAINGVSSFVRVRAGKLKPTKVQISDAEKLLTITPGMEKHPDINRMVKMYAALSKNRALDDMSVRIDPNDAGLKYFTKEELAKVDYAEMPEGLYHVAGETKDGKVNLKRASGPESVIEETSHFIYDHIERMAKQEITPKVKEKPAAKPKTEVEPELDGPYSQLWNMIKIWEASVKNRAAQLNVEVPQGPELFAPVFTAHMGYADSYKVHRPVINRIQMPDPLLKLMRRVWQDDDVLKGRSTPQAPDIIPGDKTPGVVQEAAEPKYKRKVEDVQSDIANMTDLLSKSDEGPQKKEFNTEYQRLLRERTDLLEAPGQSIVPSARHNLELFKKNPKATGIEDFLKELDEQIADPDNAGRVESLTKIRNQAKNLYNIGKKQGVYEKPDKAFQLKRAEFPEEMKAFAEQDKENIKIRLDEKLSDPEKLNVIDKMSAENEKIIEPLLKKIDKKLGTKSKSGRKKHETILSKIKRPELLKRKPWMKIEHVSDTYRFQTDINKTSDVTEVLNIVMETTGAEIATMDNRMFDPTSLGYRAVNVDLMMSNGQLVEFQMPIKEISDVKSKGHKIYEQLRGMSAEDLVKSEALIKESNELFQGAFDSFLSRSGESPTAAKASLSKLSAFEPSTRLKLSSKSLPETAPADQVPPSLRKPLPSEITTILPVSASSATITSLPPDIPSIRKLDSDVNLKVAGVPKDWRGLSLADQKEAVRGLVNRLTQYANEGYAAKDWYKDSSNLILKMARGNKTDAKDLAKLIAMTSQKSSVDYNIHEAVRFWYQFQDQKIRGIHPEDMKFEGGVLKNAMGKKAYNLLVKGEEPTGKKVNSFYRNILSEIDEQAVQGVTNDTWMGRAFGFKGEGKFTDAQYEFMTKVQNDIANRIGVEPREVQAMIWTSVMDRWNKARPDVMRQGLKDGWARTPDGIISVKKDNVSQSKYIDAMFEAVPKIADDINPDTYSYVDAFNKLEGRLAWEATPGKTTGLLKGIHEAPYEVRMKYHTRVMDAMSDEAGNNVILKEISLLEKSKHTLPGIWMGETNPSTVYKIPLPQKAGVKAADLDPGTESMMNMAAAMYGYFTKQEGVGWNFPKSSKRMKEANMSQFKIDRYMKSNEAKALELAVNKEFGEGAVAILPNEQGPSFLNFTNESWWDGRPISNAEFQKRIDGVSKKILPDDGGESIMLSSKSNLLENDWTKDINGEGYYNEIRNRGGSEKFRRVDGILTSKLEKVNREFADEYGFGGVHDEAIPIGEQPGPGLGKEGTEGAVPATAYTLKRHTETPPPKSSGRGGQTFDVSSEKAWDSFRRVFQDRFHPVKRVQKAIEKAGGEIGLDADTYLAEVVYYGRGQARVENAGKTLVDPIANYMKEKKLALQEVDDYLYARHAPERNAFLEEKGVKDGSGMSNKEAAAIMENLRGEGKVKDLNAIAKMVDKMHKRILDIKLEGGLIGEEYFQTLPGYKYYVPLRGFEDPHHPLAAQGQIPGTKSKGFSVSTKERKTMGRKSRPDSRLSNSVAMLNEAIVNSEKNKVGQAFLKMVLENPDGTFIRPDGARMKMWEIDPVKMTPYMDGNGQVAYRKQSHMTLAPNEFSVAVDGQQHIISIADPNLANAMKQMGANSGNLFIKGLTMYNRFLAMINTSLNPEFVFSNFARDAQTAGFHLGAEQGGKVASNVAKDLFPALAGAIGGANGMTGSTWTNWYHRYRNAGGKVGWFGLKNIDDISGELQKKIRRTGKWGKTLESAKAVGDLLGSINEGVENSFRLATFKNMVEGGMPEAKAAMVAKELTVNFNRKGEVGSVVNGLYLFFNASLQGISRMTQAVVTNKKMQAIGAGMVTQGYLTSLYNYGMAGDDDAGYNNFDRVPPWEKERNMIFMDPSGDGQYTKLPMPYGYNIFWNIGSAMAEMQKGNRSEAEISKDLFMSSISAFNPLGTQNSKTAFGTIMRTVMPTVGQAGIQHLLNENFAGKPIKPEQAPWGVKKPESQVYFPGARLASKKVAEKLNSATGGTIHRPGHLDVSPEVIDHYWDNYTGGLGKFMANSSDMMFKLFNGETPDVSKTPFLRRMRGEVNDYWTISKYRQINDELGQLKRDERIIRSDGSEVEKAKLNMYAQMKSMNTNIRQIREMKNNLKSKGGEPEKIEKLDKKMMALRNKFLRKWRDKVEKKEFN